MYIHEAIGDTMRFVRACVPRIACEQRTLLRLRVGINRLSRRLNHVDRAVYRDSNRKRCYAQALRAPCPCARAGVRSPNQRVWWGRVWQFCRSFLPPPTLFDGVSYLRGKSVPPGNRLFAVLSAEQISSKSRQGHSRARNIFLSLATLSRDYA
jgi:hypothetical protein